jgi:hypothetical protein
MRLQMVIKKQKTSLGKDENFFPAGGYAWVRL